MNNPIQQTQTRLARNTAVLAIAASLLFTVLCASAQLIGDRLQIDFLGNLQYAHNNFTDLQKPYDGIDTYGDLKISYWLDKNQRLSPFVSTTPVWTSEDKFWWQRNCSIQGGLQLYPFFSPDHYSPLSPVRLFGMYSGRLYYDKPEGATDTDTDVVAGMDYYYDNLFKTNILTYLVYTSATYRKSNYSFPEYSAFLWVGNVKLGPKFRLGSSILLPYGCIDFAYVPKYAARWWENYFRVGGGIRLYPLAYNKSRSPFVQELMRRFHIYAEVIQNVGWLGDQAPSVVETTDFRAGIGFATGGFTRDLYSR